MLLPVIAEKHRHFSNIMKGVSDTSEILQFSLVISSDYILIILKSSEVIPSGVKS